MIPVDQTLLVERDGMGDCLRACVASILERPIGAVPLCDREVTKMMRWLNTEGFETDLFIPAHDEIPTGVEFAVLCGPSPRFKNGSHAIVGRREGVEFVAVHDPHPSRAGIDGPPHTIITFWRKAP